MARISYWIEGSALGTHTVSDSFEIDDAELEGKTAKEREKIIEGAVQDEVTNSVQWGWEEAPD